MPAATRSFRAATAARCFRGPRKLAPAGTPKAIVEQLQAAVAKALDAPDAREKLAQVGCEPFKSTPDQFAALIKDDLPKWARIVKESGATVD